MKTLLAVAAALTLLVSPSWAKHAGGGKSSHHHSKSDSGSTKGDKDKGDKGTKNKRDTDSKDNPLATFLNTVTKKQH